MNAPLYNIDILRLAARGGGYDRLAAPMASVERRSQVCGSRVTVDVDLDNGGRVAAVGMLVEACAFGQASAALMAAHVAGRSAGEIAAARDALAAWLAGERDTPPDWPGLEIFAAALAHRGRHAAIRLAFEAAADAAAQAETGGRD